MAKRRVVDITYDAKTSRYKKQVNNIEQYTKNAINRVQTATKRMDTVFNRMAKSGLGYLGGGYVLTAMVRSTASSMIDLENGMRNVNTIMKVGEKEFARYTDQVRNLQSHLGIGAQDLTAGLYQLVSAGVSSADAIDLLSISARASIAGISTVETAVDGLTSVLNAFHLDAKEAERIADIMFKTVELGKTDFTQLSSAIAEFAPVAYALGLTFEQTAAGLATVTKQGVRTGQAATQLNAIFTAVLKNQDRARAMGNDVAIAFSAQSLKAKGLHKYLVDLNTALNGDLEAMAKLLGRSEAIKEMLQMVGGNANMASMDLDAMTNSIGAMNKAFEEQTKKKSFKWNQFKEKFYVTFGKMLEKGADIAIPFLDAINNAMDAFDKGIPVGTMGLLNALLDEAKEKVEALENMPDILKMDSTDYIKKLMDEKYNKFSEETTNAVETELALSEAFNLQGKTAQEVTDHITALRDARKDLVLWSAEYIRNLKEEERLSKYLKNQPVNYTKFGKVDNKGLMFGELEKDKSDEWLRSVTGTPDIRFSQRSDKFRKEYEEWFNTWLINSMDNQDQLYETMLRNTSELGNALEMAFSGHGDTLLSKLNQALQIALRISDALNTANKNNWDAGSIIGAVASFVPGLGFFSGLFGGGRASGGSVRSGHFYEVNETGKPEMLSMGNKDYLMMGSNSGNVTPHEKIYGSFSSKFVNDIGGRLDAQTALMEEQTEAFMLGLQNTKLESEITNKGIYLSNRQGTKIYNRYH